MKKIPALLIGGTLLVTAGACADAMDGDSAKTPLPAPTVTETVTSTPTPTETASPEPTPTHTTKVNLPRMHKPKNRRHNWGW